MILSKVSEICTENVKRIQNIYENMYNSIRQFPKNEKELVILKNVINHHEKDISKNEKTVE